ncbi:hypothetical protein CSB45_03995 [candidate division KSB3 bacterium]|uniref:Soluble ligand binding domain-containing protein n=1 Tax=candidate division KSB3 bacterium TaxID=2044937 RepID=A0A2G6E8Y9_9BACT|nr:MAG: hypothetical protein CSB45_03995 [candidate division KSB3 bacterium]PIE30542.1 MAG: hypothetical protein CSA57_02580 [candidate division KSB3 bacterium]
MKIAKTCCVILFLMYVLSGCGSPSSDSELSVQSMSVGKQGQRTSVATITDMSIREKPGRVTRVLITLDKKAPYATSREGDQLIVSVFNARLNSSLKQLELQNPVVKSVVSQQKGNDVKNIIKLIGTEVAYRPGILKNPSRIYVDIWKLSPNAAMKTSGGKSGASMKTLDVGVFSPAPDGKDVTMASAASSSEDMPAQLEWFSAKLSEVLQEREKAKEELLHLEEKLAVKDSMAQVLERKIKEANNRIVELEEDVIESNSKVSLAEQSESAARRDLQQKSVDLNHLAEQVNSLKRELDALLKERDKLLARNEEYQTGIKAQQEASAVEVDRLKGEIARLSSVEGQLNAREKELVRLRRAVGDAARLVMPAAPAPAAAPMPRQVSVQSQKTMPSSGATRSSAPTIGPISNDRGKTAAAVADPQRVLAELLKNQPMQTPTNPDDYVLGPGDMLEIKVVNEENLDKVVTVSMDGFITYPLLGDLRVDGLTTGQLRAQVASLLARDFLVNPEVLVSVVKPRSKKVYIMGMVKKPGYHELQGDERLLSTLLSAGGPNSFESEARILRLPKQDVGEAASTDTLAPVVVDLNRLFVDGDQTQNIYLQDGDVLMVAAKGAQHDGGNVAGGAVPAMGPRQFYVVGSVAKPGIYNFNDDDTVLDAILRAGGFTEFASMNGTKVVREADGRTETFRIKMKDVMEDGDMEKNIAIMPGDMIIVPESFF